MILHGHLDVVPGQTGAVRARAWRATGSIGRGAYDMKGALAAMMCAVRDAARRRPTCACVFVVHARRGVRGGGRPRRRTCSSREGLRGRLRDHRRAHRPAHRRPGEGRARVATAQVAGTAAHGSTPWLGDNAILKARRRVPPRSRRCRSAASPPTCSTAPRSTWPASSAGTRSTRCPTPASIDVDIRYLPGQDPARSSRRSATSTTSRSSRLLIRMPAMVDAEQPVRRRADARRSAQPRRARSLSVGRDGASDAVCFLEAGMPAVEFGPVGGGHHGPAEWVSLSHSTRYRARSSPSSA